MINIYRKSVFYFELVSVSQWSNGRTPVRKTGDLRFKSQLRHKFFSQYLSYKYDHLIYKINMFVCSKCQPTALLRASGSAQGG